MSKTVLVNVVAAVLLCMCVCILSEPCVVQGQIIVTPNAADFGEVEEGRIITAKTTVENRGSGPVQITNIRTN